MIISECKKCPFFSNDKDLGPVCNYIYQKFITDPVFPTSLFIQYIDNEPVTPEWCPIKSQGTVLLTWLPK